MGGSFLWKQFPQAPWILALLLQVWHGIHGWVGTALINADVDALASKALDCLEYIIGSPFRSKPTDHLDTGIRMFLNTIILVEFLFIYSGAFTPERARWGAALA